MLLRYILSITLITLSTASIAQGKFCIAKLDASSEDGIGVSHRNKKESSLQRVFDVQIDKLRKVRVSETTSVCIDNLSVKKRHLVKIYRDNILKESFWFSFDKYSHKKCLWYKGFYQTWSLSDGSCQ